MKLDFDTLYNEAKSEAMTSGKKRYYDNKVSPGAAVKSEGKTVIGAAVDSAAGSPHHVQIVFDEQGGLYDYSCDCDKFQVADGPCRHIVAAGLAYEEKHPHIGETSPARPTSGAVYQLITEYSKKKYSRRFGENKEVQIRVVPTIDISVRPVVLRLTVGRDKQYFVKDIGEFLDCFRAGTYKRYGVALEFHHHLENLDESSRRLVEFLMRAHAEKRDLDLIGEGGKDEFTLLWSDLDEIFDIYAERLINMVSGVSTGLRYVENESNHELKVFVKKVDGGYEISGDLKEFILLKGKNSNYLITDTRVIPFGQELSSAVLPLLESLNIHGQLFVSDADMSAFYNNVLAPVLKYIPAVTGGVDLTAFETAPLSAKLYVGGQRDRLDLSLECWYDENRVDIFDESYMTSIRDFEAEKALATLLYKYCPEYPLLFIEGEDNIYKFISAGIPELFPYAEIYISEELSRLRVKKPPRIKVGVRVKSNLIDVDVSADEYSSDELRAILDAYREKKAFVRLVDGSFVDLSDPAIAGLSGMLVGAQLDNGKATLPVYYAPYISSELKTGFFSVERSDAFKTMVTTLSDAVNSHAAVPDEVKGVLRNYQKTGFRWMKALCDYGFGGILADDMGLGKSLQLMTLLLSDRGSPSIIVCPTTLILNWDNEFKKFAPDMKVLPVYGSAETRTALISNHKDYDVIITSYELMRRDDELYKNIEFNYAVLDEAQYIKNPDTKNAKSVKSLKARHRLALTGTPIENGLSELWSIFDFIMPGYLGSYPHFRDEFELEISRGAEDAATRLKRLVRPFILRRLKSEVLSELPEKIETIITAKLENEQELLYKSNLAMVRESLVAGPSGNVNKVIVLSMLTKLRQIACEPSLVYPDYTGNSAKLETCLSLIASATESGHRVLLFSQFTSMLDIISRKLTEINLTHFMLKGDTPKPERVRLVSRFNEGNTPVFLISLKAGGTGLNLTGADMVIHYDPWWNESVMNQATDRAYRIGQKRSVQVYKLILENTLEEKIVQLQEKKTALSNLVIDNVRALSGKDLLTLLD